MTEFLSGEPAWRTARFCATGNCVRVASHGGQFLLGDTKAPEAHLTFERQEWAAFVDGIKAGDFDDRGTAAASR